MPNTGFPAHIAQRFTPVGNCQLFSYTGEVPAGYIPVRSKTYNTFTGMRSILASNSEEDEQKGDALVKQIRIYPLSKADNPPAQRFVDMTDIMYDGLASVRRPPYVGYWQCCARWARRAVDRLRPATLRNS